MKTRKLKKIAHNRLYCNKSHLVVIDSVPGFPRQSKVVSFALKDPNYKTVGLFDHVCKVNTFA